MFDAHDQDLSVVLVDAVDDTVPASTSPVVAGKVALEWLAESTWVVGQRPETELGDGSGGFLRQPIEQAAGTRREEHPVTIVGHAPEA